MQVHMQKNMEYKRRLAYAVNIPKIILPYRHKTAHFAQNDWYDSSSGEIH